MYKRIFSKLLFGFLFCMCMLFAGNDSVRATYLDMENTKITEENAIVSAMVYTDQQPMESVTIIVKKNGEEIKTKRIEVNTYESARYTFDFQKDLNLTLEKDCLYEYAIIQQMSFTNDDYVVGQFYTGEDTYVTVYTVVVEDVESPDKEKGIVGVECIFGVTPGDSFLYKAEIDHPKYDYYSKIDQNYDFGISLPCEYEIPVVSEDPSKNIIRNQYCYSVAPTGTFIIGGYYLKDSESKERIGKGVFWCPVDMGKVYVPEDVIVIDGQYYIYDAVATTSELYVDMGRPFYENVYDIYYKKIEKPTTKTSAIINYINVETGEQICQETISNLTIGESFVYTPENFYRCGKYNYIYATDENSNGHILDKLLSDAKNNVLTVYYKVMSEVQQTFPVTKTSVIVNFVNEETGKLIKRKNICNLLVGQYFSYTPENTCMDNTYNYSYVPDSFGNMLVIDNLWTNPEKNILTVCYKTVSEEKPQDIVIEEKPQNIVTEEKPQDIVKKSNPLKKEKPVIKTVSRKSKTTAKLKFSKVKKAQGYEICYSTKKSFKTCITKRVKKNTITLKNLKKRKTYYVKVRGYRKVNGEVFYSKYSKVKRI